jgi:hypothetical protein
MKKERISSAIKDATTTTTTINNTDDNFNNDCNNENHNDDLSINSISDSKISSENKGDKEKTHSVHEFKDDTLEYNQHMNFKAYTSFKVISSSSLS